MRRELPVAAVLLCVTFAVHGQPAPCPSTGNVAPSSYRDFNWRTHFVAISRIGNHFMTQFGDGDSMSEPYWLNKGASPGFGSTGYRETWYIPRENVSGTASLNRFFSPTDANHLDHWITSSSGGYGFELTLGYPYTSQKPGTLPVTRYMNGGIFDHRTWLNSQVPAGYAVDAVLNTAGGVPRYGYERFGGLVDRCSVLASAYRDVLQNSTLKVQFNKVWGNSIGRITYVPKNQQLVDEEIGAMVQSTIFTGADNVFLLNPNESGGADQVNYSNTTRWVGSPVISTQAVNSRTRRTVVKPFNWESNGISYQGVRLDGVTPLLWNGTFEKTVTLGYTAGTQTYDDVLKITFGAKLDPDAPPAMASYYTAAGMNNTFWLWRDVIGTAAEVVFDYINMATNKVVVSQHPLPRMQTGDKNQTDHEWWLCNENTATPVACPSHPAVIVYNRANSDATAYGYLRRQIGSDRAHAIKLMHFCNGAADPCTFGRPEVVFDTFRNRALSSTSYQYDTVFLVVGPVGIVRARLWQIYCQETGACVP